MITTINVPQLYRSQGQNLRTISDFRWWKNDDVWKKVDSRYLSKRLIQLNLNSHSFSHYFLNGPPPFPPRVITWPASTRLTLVNSVWLGLSLWHGESYLIKISLYHTPRACQQFLTIRHQLLSLIGQTHNIYMNCSWNWNKLWRFTWTLTIRWPLIFLDKKDSTPPRMWILLLPSENAKLELNRDKKFANDFAKICLRLAPFLPRLSHLESNSYNVPSHPYLFLKVLCKVKSHKISLPLHTSFGRGMRFYVSLMGLKCSDTSLSRVRVPRKVLTISLPHHQS